MNDGSESVNANVNVNDGHGARENEEISSQTSFSLFQDSMEFH